MMFCVRFVFIMMFSFSLYAEGSTIVLVAAKNSPVVNSLYKRLKQQAPNFIYSLSTEAVPIDIQSDDFVILVGNETPSYFDISRHSKSIAVLLSRSQAQTLNVKTSIWVEPPLNRQLTLANIVVPGDTKMGLLVNGEMDKRAQLTGLTAEQQDMLKIVDVNDFSNLNQALFQVLKETKLLLGSYENTIYNAKNIKNILITSYRQQKVLIGPSRAFLKAGSFATTYSDLNHIALRIVDIVNAYQTTQQWIEAGYNPHYSIKFNLQVARSLNVPIMDTLQLKQQMDDGD